MKNIALAILISLVVSGTAHGQATVMVNTNTGAIRYPTNFVPANDLATVAWSTGREALVRADLSSVSGRVTSAEGTLGTWKRDMLAIGSNAVVAVTPAYVVVSGNGTPIGATGIYWAVTSTNYSAFASANGWFIWKTDYWENTYVTTNLSETNGAYWSASYESYTLGPRNGATGTLTFAEMTAPPTAQFGAGTNESPGALQWRGQLIADGTMGIYIGGRWVTNSTALAQLTSTNGVLLWGTKPLADSNGMAFISGQLWTNRLTVSNMSFITSVSTNAGGELVAVTSTVRVVTTP
jgi:hypothetical protein